MASFNVAICAPKGFIKKLYKNANEKTKDFLNKAEIHSQGKNEILYWPWEKWQNESPEITYIKKNLPEKHDFVLVDEEGEVCEAHYGVGILSVETIITWQGIDEECKHEMRKNFKETLSAIRIEEKKKIIEAAEKYYLNANY